MKFAFVAAEKARGEWTVTELCGAFSQQIRSPEKPCKRVPDGMDS